MIVTLEIPTYLQPFVNGQKTIETEGTTVGECLKYVIKQFPEMGKMLFDKNGKLYGYVSVYINGEDAYPEELKKPVNDGDRIQVLYIIGGG